MGSAGNYFMDGSLHAQIEELKYRFPSDTTSLQDAKYFLSLKGRRVAPRRGARRAREVGGLISVDTSCMLGIIQFDDGDRITYSYHEIEEVI